MAGTDDRGGPAQRRAERRWLRVEVACEGVDVLEWVAAEIATRFSTAVQLEQAGLVVYLEPDRETGAGGMERALRELIGGLGQGRCRVVRVSEIADEDWARQWKKHFKPLRVGNRLWIAPSWESCDHLVGQRVIRIDPGRAFGTGHHETTRLCIEWLEEYAESRLPESPGSLLDVGTGTGILAITAGRLGFRPVMGIDNDGDAVQVALENRGRNSFAQAVEFHIGVAADVKRTFAVVVANIQAGPLVEMAGSLSRRVATGGRLVLSGVLVEQAEAVIRAYREAGMECSGRRRAGEWCLLELQF